jgi:hypothetical protein
VSHLGAAAPVSCVRFEKTLLRRITSGELGLFDIAEEVVFAAPSPVR